MSQQSNAFQNILCWNTGSRPKVMETVALRVEDSIFHATHFPCPINKLNPNTKTKTRYSEEELYQDFLDERLEHNFCVAIGDTGTGKSHLIRWLHSRLLLHNDAKDVYKSVMVPRNCANLAAVLECILEGFESPEVQKIREEIKWTHNITQQGACSRVLSELAFVLDPNNLSSSALSFPDDDDHQLNLSLLPAFLNDQAIREFLINKPEGIISRLAAHVSGKREKRPENEKSLSWIESDLDFNAAIANRAGDDAQQLATTLIADPVLKPISVKILNQALKRALPNLAGLRQGNLGNALLEIRRSLRSQGKQLILFIEDLSVTQGVDAELVEALLVAPSDGGDDLSVLRSIIGITNDDFNLRLQDNIKGRIDTAVHFDVGIATEEDDDENMVSPDELNDFASRYLNAARFSLSDLDDWYKNNPESDECESYCLKKPCPHVEHCHSIFGEVNGRGLYPFSAIAIERLYRNQMEIASSKTSFNPRLLVATVLNHYMGIAELKLPKNSFPDPSYIDWFNLSEVGGQIQALLQSHFGKRAGNRLRTALEIYSKNPFNGKLNPEIAEAFKLPLQKEKEWKKKKPGKTTQKSTQPETEKETTVPQQDAFDVWLNSRVVSDPDATRWRKTIYSAIRGAHDWGANSLGYAFYQYFSQNNIKIESQRTKVQSDLELEIKCEPEVATALRGLVNKFSTTKREDARLEMLYASELIGAWIRQIEKLLKKYVNAKGKPGPKSLALYSLALGAFMHPNGIEINSTQDLLRSLLSPWYKTEIPPTGTPSWKALCNAFNRMGEDVRFWLHQRIGCRKGKSIEVSFIDCSQIIDELSSLLKLAIPPSLPKQADKWPKSYKEIKSLCDRINQQFEKAIEAERKVCKDWFKEFDMHFGNKNPNTVIDNVMGAFEIGNDQDLFAHHTADMQTMLVAIKENNIDKQINLLKTISNNSSVKDQIRSLARLDRELITTAINTLRMAQEYINEALSYLQKEIDKEGLQETGELHQMIQALFTQILKSLNELKGEA